MIGGKESFTTAFEIEWGVPIQVPMIDIRTIGAGGGSIAWIDKGGMLQVGPQSAGAKPGPACYGRGGTEATVTDANLVLGRINPENFLGGRMRLDATAARKRGRSGGAKRSARASRRRRSPIARIVDNNMIGALRSVLIERGLDPRDFTLCAFGGADAAACERADPRDGDTRARSCRSIPAQFSAYGFILTNARVDRQRTTQLTIEVLRGRSRQRDHGRAGVGEPGGAGGAGLPRRHRGASRRWRCAISGRTTSWSCR